MRRDSSPGRTVAVARPVLHAELTKLRTIASPAWLLLATMGLTVAVSTLTVAAVQYQAGAGQDPVRISVTGVLVGQALAALFGATVITGEYGSGMVITTLTATPRREAMFAAKATVVVVPVLVAGAIGVALSLVAGRLILPGNGFVSPDGDSLLSLTAPSTLRAAVGSVLYLGLIALLSYGVATAVREPATAIGVVLGVLYVSPILVRTPPDPKWVERLERITPIDAGLAIQATTDVADLPIGPWPGLGVCALWAVAALVGGGVLLWRRDA